MSYNSPEVDRYLAHFGIKGQKWGVRRYQNEDGSLTEEGRQKYTKKLEKTEKKLKRYKESVAAGVIITTIGEATKAISKLKNKKVKEILNSDKGSMVKAMTSSWGHAGPAIVATNLAAIGINRLRNRRYKRILNNGGGTDE